MKILGVVRGKEDDDGFPRAQSHVTKHYDQIRTKSSKPRRDLLASSAAIRATVEVRGVWTVFDGGKIQYYTNACYVW